MIKKHVKSFEPTILDRVHLKQRLFMPDEANFLAAQDANIITLFKKKKIMLHIEEICVLEV